MRFIHLADLHIGKRVANYSLLEDQEYVFRQIIKGSEESEPDAVLIAGDVFDRSVPAEDAIKLYEDFIGELAQIAPIYMISGNHDSGRRLGLFSDKLMGSGIHIAGKFEGTVERRRLDLKEGPVDIYMLPFISPSDGRMHFDPEIASYEESVEAALKDLELESGAINILLSHQFYLNNSHDYESIKEGSETPAIGGLDDVSSSLIKQFDYAALGHIHGVRELSERIRYCGTPMKYSVNDSAKFLNIVDLTKDSVSVTKKELVPLRDMRKVAGTFDELRRPEMYSEDFVSIRLLDDKAIPNAKAQLLENFPNILEIDYNYIRENEDYKIKRDILSKDPIDLLEEFFVSCGQELGDKEREIAVKIFADLKAEEE